MIKIYKNGEYVLSMRVQQIQEPDFFQVMQSIFKNGYSIESVVILDGHRPSSCHEISIQKDGEPFYSFVLWSGQIESKETAKKLSEMFQDGYTAVYVRHIGTHL